LAFRTHIPGPKEIAVMTLTVGGDSSAFVKIDAAIHVESGYYDMGATAWIENELGETSNTQRFRIEPYLGTPAALTWAIPVSPGLHTFRVMLAHPVADPNCANFNSCPSMSANADISAISAPFGAHGTKTLD
jgi:hypothetical protein